MSILRSFLYELLWGPVYAVTDAFFKWAGLEEEEQDLKEPEGKDPTREGPISDKPIRRREMKREDTKRKKPDRKPADPLDMRRNWDQQLRRHYDDRYED